MVIEAYQSLSVLYLISWRVAPAPLLLPKVEAMAGSSTDLTSPAKSSPVEMTLEISSYAKRLPTPNFKNKDRQEGALAAQRTFQLCISAFQQDHDLILPAWNDTVARMERKRKATMAEGEGEYLNCGTLKGIPLDLKVRFIQSVSDLTAAECMQIHRVNKDVIDILMLAALQTGLGAKLPNLFHVSDVLFFWMTQRNVACGRRLRTIKADGVVDIVTGAIDMPKLSGYLFRYGLDGRLMSVAFKFGPNPVTKTLEDELITCVWQTRDAHDDMNGCFLKDGKRPQFFHEFFTDDEGPHAMVQFTTGKVTKALQKTEEAVVKEYEEKQRQVKGNSAQETQEIKDEVAKQKGEEAKGTMNTARAKAKARLERRNKLRVASVGHIADTAPAVGGAQVVHG